MIPIDVSSSQLETINLILAEHVPERNRTLAFGSRAKWTAKAQSDLDLAIDAGRKLKFAELAALEDAFESSPLPWRVDVIDLNGVSEGFRSVILRDGVVLPAWKPQSGWRDQKLGDLIELKRGYDLPQGQRRAGPYPIISSSGLSGHHDRFMAKAPGVVTGRYGTIGEVFYVTENFWPLNTALYVRDFKGAHPRYVYYLLKTLNWSLFNDKSGVPGVNRNHVHEAVVRAPALAEQKRIAGCLSAFDDKIELNRRMSETLEAMAQAIFRDWFVDFGPVRRTLAGETDPIAIMGGLTPDPARAAELAALFPAAFDEAGQPQGWELATLAELATHCKGSINPLAHPGVEFEHYSLPAFDSGQEPAVNRGADIRSNKTPVSAGAVLLSKLNPEIPRIWLPNPPSGRQQIASTEFLIFQPLPGVGRGLLYCLFRDPTVRQILAGMVTGTSKSHQRISPPALMKTPLLIGSGEAFGAFGEFAEPLLQRVLSLRTENRTLAETRDYLLPRLMSGQVRGTASDTESAAA